MDREQRWMAKRAKCFITASNCPNLMKSGRSKNVLWGETAKDVLFAAKYQHRTGLELEQKDLYQFKWGHEQEPNAIEWLKLQTMHDVISCANDFEDIVFNQPFPGFGDSPDAYVNGKKIVCEIKCPVDQVKIEKLREETCIHDKHEYYWQFLAHFIGSPESDELWWVIYDGYADDGHIVKMLRKDHLDNIEKLTARINDGIYVVKKCLEDPENYKIGNVEQILNERE